MGERFKRKAKTSERSKCQDKINPLCGERKRKKEK
jgi:hypothetical protein